MRYATNCRDKMPLLDSDIEAKLKLIQGDDDYYNPTEQQARMLDLQGEILAGHLDWRIAQTITSSIDKAIDERFPYAEFRQLEQNQVWLGKQLNSANGKLRWVILMALVFGLVLWL